MALARSLDDQITGWSITKWSNRRMTGWSDDWFCRMTRWLDDLMIRWPEVWMTRWSDGRMIKWPDGQKTGWPEVRMTGWPEDHMAYKTNPEKMV